MPAKYYAVVKGTNPGIYRSWEDCKSQVHGYPGAVYKSFKTEAEAKDYMLISDKLHDSKPTQKDLSGTCNSLENTNPLIVSTDVEATAYVDGSYNADTKEFSYGVVMFHNGLELHMSEKVDSIDLASMRNVAGEIKGAEAAMRYAVNHGCTELTIYHDYEGISKWCLGLWKTNKEGTIAYKKYYDSIKDKIDIKFVKVKGHSNDIYNDLADQLAKAAIFH